MVNPVTTLLLTSSLHRRSQRIFKTNTNYFCVRINISLAVLSEIFIQIGSFSKSYARKQKWMLFSEHSVYALIFEDRIKLSSDTQANTNDKSVDTKVNYRS